MDVTSDFVIDALNHYLPYAITSDQQVITFSYNKKNGTFVLFFEPTK